MSISSPTISNLMLASLLMHDDERFVLADAIAGIEGDARRAEQNGGPETSWEEILRRAVSKVVETRHALGEPGLLEKIARAAHEVNRIYCESIGDMSQPTWEDAPEWQRDSAMSGVRHLLLNRDATPEDSHLNWLADKRRDGWFWGEVKDPVAKTHPCMVPYAELPEAQRRKDAFFHAVVRSMQP